ncbi:dynein heavy chain 10, axonemal-like, partial [Cyclospora cayetanensis]|uniref:Dynein heavy chain 10, axonemal-like n=1 Tax=Cyclospora cayetanensis TaxID=88456 RepID=A0A6P6S2D2_9EIME
SSNPEVFGLHPNAEIGYFVENAKSIWHGLLKINITCHSGNKGDSALGNLKETTLVATISEIFEKVPSKPLYFCPDSDPPTPIEIVLAQTAASTGLVSFIFSDAHGNKSKENFLWTFCYQELDRLNILLQAVIQSLRELRHALRGDIGMSMDLDELALSLQAGVLPRQWRALAPPTSKSLGSWISHLMRRISQYTTWKERGSLSCYWLGGLHMPRSLSTALIQVTSRKKGISLDKLVLFTEFTQLEVPQQIESPLEDGAYIEGLFIEGARWNSALRRLAPQAPRELLGELPLMKLVPIESHRLKTRSLLRTPVYVTQERRTPMGEGLVFDAWLPFSEHSSFWILSGTALVLETSD